MSFAGYSLTFRVSIGIRDCGGVAFGAICLEIINILNQLVSTDLITTPDTC